MIQAVIFDCFGVLATDGWLPFKRTYFAHDAALMQQASDLNKQNDAGLKSYEDFIKEVSELAGVRQHVTLDAIENNVPNAELFNYIKTLKSRYKIAMLSNAGDNWLSELFTPEQVALFDQIALSYETGFIKPRPEAYQVILDRLGVPASDCVFIDDQPAYGEAAKDVGMQFIQYTDNDQLKRDLNALLADSEQ
jgi:HAD superfamily hydrolase (TIGR01509 family)